MRIPKQEADEILASIEVAKHNLAKGDYPRLGVDEISALDHLHMWALGLQVLARLTELPETLPTLPTTTEEATKVEENGEETQSN